MLHYNANPSLLGCNQVGGEKRKAANLELNPRKTSKSPGLFVVQGQAKAGKSTALAVLQAHPAITYVAVNEIVPVFRFTHGVLSREEDVLGYRLDTPGELWHLLNDKDMEATLVIDSITDLIMPSNRNAQEGGVDLGLPLFLFELHTYAVYMQMKIIVVYNTMTDKFAKNMEQLIKAKTRGTVVLENRKFAMENPAARSEIFKGNGLELYTYLIPEYDLLDPDEIYGDMFGKPSSRRRTFGAAVKSPSI